jgi:hypothetical protein
MGLPRIDLALDGEQHPLVEQKPELLTRARVEAPTAGVRVWPQHEFRRPEEVRSGLYAGSELDAGTLDGGTP